MAPTEKVATASRLEARMVRISSTDSPPNLSVISGGGRGAATAASSAAPTPRAA
jgi:hypothetical protein